MPRNLIDKFPKRKLSAIDEDSERDSRENIAEKGIKRKRERGRKAVFQVIHHKRSKTRLPLNGRGREPRDATCTLVLISLDVARARLSFRRIVVLFYVSTPLKRAACSLLLANEHMPREREDGKMNMYMCTPRPSSYVK